MTAITDHAVLRYLERAYGLDVEAIKVEMNSPVVQLAEGFGCGTVIGRNGVRLTIRDGVMTTVLPSRHRRGRR